MITINQTLRAEDRQPTPAICSKYISSTYIHLVYTRISMYNGLPLCKFDSAAIHYMESMSRNINGPHKSIIVNVYSWKMISNHEIVSVQWNLE